MILRDTNHIKYRRGLFSVNDFFLTGKAEADADINYFIQCSENTARSLNEFYTLLIDLSQTPENISEDVYHRTRSEINSFISNQNFEHKILFPVPDDELDRFIRMYDSFAREKKIRKAETYRLKAYNKNGILAVSYLKQENHTLCLNFYRITKERAANLYSFCVRNDLPGKFNNTHLGRAHRTLHWLDILEFKTHGVRYYDFCGWYQGETDKDLLNVNKFKEQFTKNKVKEYTGVIYKNKLLILLLKLLR